MFAEASHSDAGPVLLLNVWKSFPNNFGVKQTSKLGKNQIKIIEENSPGTILLHFHYYPKWMVNHKTKDFIWTNQEYLKDYQQIIKILKNCLQVNSSF